MLGGQGGMSNGKSLWRLGLAQISHLFLLIGGPGGRPVICRKYPGYGKTDHDGDWQGVHLKVVGPFGSRWNVEGLWITLRLAMRGGRAAGRQEG